MKHSRAAVSALSAALLCAAASAETIPVKGPADPRVRVVAYDGNEVYKLHGRIGYQIDLQFEAGETFSGLGAGDIEALSFVGKDNHLFLKPKAAKVATNLTVLTSRRHYQIDYSASPKGADDDEIIYALRFTYVPSDAEQASAAASRRVDAELERASGGRPHNIDYWYCGHPALKPTAASDDGVHTRLTFAANADLPAVFVHNDDDSESLLNFSIDSGDVVIHRVARRLIVRRGKLTGCIVNQGFSGNGARLESGTVTPAVQRQLRAGTP